MYDNKDSKRFKTLAVLVFLTSTVLKAEVNLGGYNGGTLTNEQYQAAQQALRAQGQGGSVYGVNPDGTLNTNLNGLDPLNINSYSGLMQGTIQNARNAQGPVPTIAPDTNLQDDPAKKKQSGDQSNAGSAAAATAGGIMIGTGSAMVPSPIIPVAVAGANLIAMGIVELAQSAASGGAGKDNNANSQYLKRTENDLGKQSTTPIDYNAALTPQARAALESAGLNPEEFMNKAATGQLGSEKDIAKMFGIDATDEQMAEAKGLLDNQLNSVFNEKTSLTLDETEKNKTVAEAGTGPASSTISAYQTNAGRTGVSSSAGTSGGATHSEGGSESAVTRRTDLVPPTVPMDSREWSSVLSQLGIPADAAPWEKKAMAEAKLGAIGIEIPRRGMNIFQKAAMRYQKFNEWRKAKSVAAR